MKTVIDSMTSATGWSGVNCTITADTWSAYATSFLGGQLKFVFSAAGSATKTLSSPVALRRNLQFSIIGDSSETIETSADYRVKFRFYNGSNYVEYYVPVGQTFQTIPFWGKNYAQVTKIEFRTTEAISFMVSEVLTYEDQFPLDLYQGIKELIENNISSADEIQVGTLTCSAGASQVTITAGKYLERYAVLKFGNEKHSIEEVNGNQVKFQKGFSGQTVTGTYTNEPVYLHIPVGFEGRQAEETIPGIGISGSFQAEKVLEAENYSPLVDSYDVTDTTVRVRTQGTTWKHKVTIEAESRQWKIIEILLGILKRSFNDTNTFYINGRRHEIQTDGVNLLDYADATDLISKIIVEGEIWITEENRTQEIQPAGNLTLTTTFDQN